MTTVDLRRLGLRPGEELRDEHEVEIAPLELGGQRYVAVPELVPAELTVTRAANGTVFRLRLTAQLHGPCYRCLEDASLDQTGRRRASTRPRIRRETTSSSRPTSPTTSSISLRGAATRSCSRFRTRSSAGPDCAGLCPVCGKNLNREPHGHEGEEIDPRWAGLAELRDSLQ